MADDLLARMRRNPAADWQMRDVQAICGQHGVRCDPPTGGGSHWKVWRKDDATILTIPARRPPTHLHPQAGQVPYGRLSMAPADYRIIIDRLPLEDGGGFLATVPDLPGCMSDGDTQEEAVRNVMGAIIEWVDHALMLGRTVPAPTQQVA